MMEISKLLTTESTQFDSGFLPDYGQIRSRVIRQQNPIASNWPLRVKNEFPAKKLKAVHAKKHKCDQCSSSFTTRSNLVVHTQTVHQGLRPFTCDKCMRSFGTKGTMNRHIRLVHFHERQYVCPLCNRRFATLACRRRHHNLLHGELGEV
uniref:C2H2-type domain-containing protein n=1 Tax=Rhodosorus marinus TaxID=101924 RepID=A0A7S0BM29_9RHOD|mmetsp:Transcript_21425/g.31192  ORF Transcript_21425/g.31192 Transcript_21425/m.31192 type:complete len:150 (+) Transcript_21425:111-560(+)